MSGHQPNACNLMIQGTSSEAGKSTLVAGLCRALLRQGWRVAPFKPLNLSLNSAVGSDGGEMGRAQAVQAAACGLPAHSDMNPVLLKPVRDHGCQIVINGRVINAAGQPLPPGWRQQAQQAIVDSHQRLQGAHQLLLIEGSGSPAEINLRERELSNMAFAEQIDCPVILVTDCERGGAFAHLFGTLALLSASEQARIKGFIINKFHGHKADLESGIRWLEQHTGKPVLGVIPFIDGLQLDAEDRLAATTANSNAALRVVIPALPHLSNHTDFEPLRANPAIDLQFIGAGDTIPAADLLILPGSKAVRSDLTWLRRHGWENAIQRHLRYGGKLLGICGGYQMLGKMIRDPFGQEGEPGLCSGLGLLDAVTVLGPHKRLDNLTGRLAWSNASVSGYAIHLGTTSGIACSRPFAHLADGADGAISGDGQIAGTYLHGLFDAGEACQVILGWAGLARPVSDDFAKLREQSLERLATTLAQHLDLDQLLLLAGVNAKSQQVANA